MLEYTPKKPGCMKWIVKDVASIMLHVLMSHQIAATGSHFRTIRMSSRIDIRCTAPTRKKSID